MAEPRSSPYVGPWPLSPNDLIYGREWEVMELFQLVVTRRIVLFHAPSGAGKTSLLSAGAELRRKAPNVELATVGVIAHLEAHGMTCLGPVRVGNPLPEGIQSAGDDTNRYTMSVIESLVSAKHGDPVALEELRGLRLQSYLERLKASNEDSKTREYVLIFDQFEEILTTDPIDFAAKTAFFTQLDAALLDPHQHAILAMRTDYVGPLDPYLHAAPDRLRNRFCIDLLACESAKKSITLPAAAAGVRFTAAAADRLVDELREIVMQRPGDAEATRVAGPYVEPVQLQLVCQRLWQSLGPKAATIDVPDLDRLGRLEDTLGDYYDECVRKVDARIAATEEGLRDWFETKLITRQGIRGQIPKAPRETEGLDNAVIESLIAMYLVRQEVRRGVTWYELSHDRFIEPIKQRNQRARAEQALTKERAAKQTVLETLEELGVKQRRHYRYAAMGAALAAAVLVISIVFGNRAKHHANAETEQLRREQLLNAGRDALLANRNLSALAYLAKARSYGENTPEIRSLFAAASRNLWLAHHDHRVPVSSVVFSDTLDPVSTAISGTVFANGVMSAVTSTALSKTVLSPSGSLVLRIAADPSEESTLVEVATGTSVWHGPHVQIGAFSGDASLLIVYDGQTITTVTTVTPTGKVRSIAFREGRADRIAIDRVGTHAALAIDNRVTVIDLTGNEPTFGVSKANSTSAIVSIALDRTGRRLLVGYADGHIALASHKGVEHLETAFKHLSLVDFSPNGNKVLAIDSENTARIIDRFTHQVERTLALDVQTLALATTNSAVSRVAVDANLSDMASPADAGVIATVNDAATPPPPATADARPGVRFDKVFGVFSPDGTLLLTAGAGHLAAVWDLETGALVTSFEEVDDISAAAFAPDAGTAALGTVSGSVRIWKVPFDDHRVRSHIAGPITAATISGDAFVIGNAAGEIEFVNESATVHKTSCRSRVIGLGIANSGSIIIVCETAVLWWTPENSTTVLEESERPVRTAATFTADHRHFATAAGSTVEEWIMESGGTPHLVAAGDVSKPVVGLAISGDGTRVATSHLDGISVIWRPRSGGLVHEWQVRARLGGFDPSGSRLYGLGESGTFLWDLDSQRSVGAERPPNQEDSTWTPIAIKTTRDGTMFVVALDDGTVRVWDARHQSTQAEVRLGGTVAFLATDDTRVASCGSDGVVKLWDARSGRLLAKDVSIGSCIRATFSQDGQSLLVVGATGAQRWNVALDVSSEAEWTKLATDCSPVDGSQPFSVSRRETSPICQTGAPRDTIETATRKLRNLTAAALNRMPHNMTAAGLLLSRRDLYATKLDKATSHDVNLAEKLYTILASLSSANAKAVESVFIELQQLRRPDLELAIVDRIAAHIPWSLRIHRAAAKLELGQFDEAAYEGYEAGSNYELSASDQVAGFAIAWLVAVALGDCPKAQFMKQQLVTNYHKIASGTAPWFDFERLKQSMEYVYPYNDKVAAVLDILSKKKQDDLEGVLTRISNCPKTAKRLEWSQGAAADVPPQPAPASFQP